MADEATGSSRAHVLIVEDSSVFREMQSLLLRQAGFAVSGHEHPHTALAAAAERKFDLVVIDYELPSMNGQQFMHKLREILPDIKVIFVSGSLTLELAIQLSREGVAGTLVVTGVETFTPAQQKILQTLLASRDVFLPFARRFRVVLAAGANLSELADSGQFNDTLYYKISSLSINVPPLRELSGDILANVRNLLDGHAAEVKAAKPFVLTPAAASWIEAQPWPGNYGQLSRTVLAACRRGAQIEVAALEAESVRNELAAAPAVARQTRSPFASRPPFMKPAATPTPALAASVAPFPPSEPRPAAPLTARGMFRPASNGYDFSQRLAQSLAAVALAPG